MLKKNNSLFILKQIQSYFLKKSFLFKNLSILDKKTLKIKKNISLTSSRVFANNKIIKKLKKFVFNNNKIFKQSNKNNKSTSPILSKLIIKNELLTSKNSFLYAHFLKNFLRSKTVINLKLNFYLENLLLEVFKLKNNFFTENEIIFLKKVYILIKQKNNSANASVIKKRGLLLLVKKYSLMSKIENNATLYFFYNKFLLSYLKTSKNIKYKKELFSNIEKVKPNQIKKQDILATAFYKKFVGLCIKKGSKTKALKFVQEALNSVSQELGLSVNFIILKLLNRLKMSLELKTVRKKVRKTKKKVFHIVPYPIRKKRELFLIIKLILKAINKKTSKVSAVQKLTQELITLLKTKKKI